MTVSGAGTTLRSGTYFAASLEAAPGNAPQWMGVTVTEQRQINDLPQDYERVGHLFWPGRAEAPLHDEDGNLIQDARWNYTWDGENRLVAMETRWSAAEVSGLPQLRLEFVYDSLGRRVGKTVKQRDCGNTWQTLRTLRFAYEGWNLIAESELLSGLPPTFSVIRTYEWGTDLSGSRQGAGGIGGLLLINAHSGNGTIQSYYPCYGDNGNIEALLDVSDPLAGVTVAAAYEYGPFGEPLRATGPMASVNPFRWSTKYQDEETSLAYYGYRYYQPQTGRWVNRDPIGEAGGVNLYAFLKNGPIGRIDIVGLAEYEIKVDEPVLVKSNDKGTGNNTDIMVAFTVSDPGNAWSPSKGPLQGPTNKVSKDRTYPNVHILLVIKNRRDWQDNPNNGALFAERGKNRWEPHIRQVYEVTIARSTGVLSIKEAAGNVWRIQSQGTGTRDGSAVASQFHYQVRDLEGPPTIVKGNLPYTYSGSGGWSPKAIVDHLYSGSFDGDDSSRPVWPLQQYLVWPPGVEPRNLDVADSGRNKDGSAVSISGAIKAICIKE